MHIHTQYTHAPLCHTTAHTDDDAQQHANTDESDKPHDTNTPPTHTADDTTDTTGQQNPSSQQPPSSTRRTRPIREDEEDPLEVFMRQNEQQLVGKTPDGVAATGGAGVQHTTAGAAASGVQDPQSMVNAEEEEEPDPLDAFMTAEVIPEVTRAFAPVRAAAAAAGSPSLPPGGEGEDAMDVDSKPTTTGPTKVKPTTTAAAGTAGKTTAAAGTAGKTTAAGGKATAAPIVGAGGVRRIKSAAVRGITLRLPALKALPLSAQDTAHTAAQSPNNNTSNTGMGGVGAPAAAAGGSAAQKRKRSAIRYVGSDESDLGGEDEKGSDEEEDMDDEVRMLSRDDDDGGCGGGVYGCVGHTRVWG